MGFKLFNSENGSIDYSLGLITSTSPISVTGKEYDMTVTFNENPNEVISDGSFVIETEFDVADVENPEDETIEGFFDADNWSLNGDILTITEAGRSSSFRITELSSSIMRLETDLETIDAFSFLEIFQLFRY